MGMVAIGKRTARRLVIGAMARANLADRTIQHHYTKKPLKLHPFRHKGYWYYGKKREQATMAQFAHLIRPGDHVVEVGGHIGYIGMYFAHLVGDGGLVHVFEPGHNNLPYIRTNLAALPNASLIEKAVGKEAGELVMYVEDLTGQNNSLVPDFAGLRVNQANAIRANITKQYVQVTTIDDHVATTGINPALIKIDVEGFEHQVLSGARATLRTCRPAIMVEVQTHHREIETYLLALNYALRDDAGNQIHAIPEGTNNIFAIPAERISVG